MAVLPDKIQEFFDSWDEAQQQTGTAWDDFFGGNTWDLMTPAQQQAVTEYYLTNEVINQTYQNMKTWLENLIDSGGTIPDDYGFDGGTFAGSFYKLSTTGNKLYPCLFYEYPTDQPRGLLAKSQHFEIIGALRRYRNPGTGDYIDDPTTLEDTTLYTVSLYDVGQPSGQGNGVQYKSTYTGKISVSANLIDKSSFFLETSWSYGAYNVYVNVRHDPYSIPTHTQGSSIPDPISGGSKSFVQIDNGSISTDTPWDYYNDILPDIIGDLPEDVPPDVIPFYPDGYDPGEPVDPDPEDASIDDIDGTDEELNTDGVVSSTSRMLTTYVLTGALVDKLGGILWTSPSHWGSGDSLTDSWKNFIFNFNVAADTGTYDISSLMEFIVSLQIYPFSFATLDPTLVAESALKVGAGFTDFLPDDDVYSLTTYCTSLYLGGATVPNLYGGDYRDYANTRVTIHLPYCGSTDLPANVVAGKNLDVNYAIDFLSGNCTASVKVIDETSEVGFVIASLPGKIGFMLPVTATNQGQVANKMLNTWFNSGMSVINALTGNLSGAVRGMYDTATAFAHGGTSSPLIAAQDMSGMLLINKPYLIVTRSRYKTPTGYTSYVGRPSTQSGTIGSFTGWTKFVNPDLSGIHATETEKSKILNILESGVFVG